MKMREKCKKKKMEKEGKNKKVSEETCRVREIRQKYIYTVTLLYLFIKFILYLYYIIFVIMSYYFIYQILTLTQKQKKTQQGKILIHLD